MAKNAPLKHKIYLGLMSGTSFDGVDAALVDFGLKKPKLVASYSHPIPSALKDNLLAAMNPEWQCGLVSIGHLHQQLGELFADASNNLIQNANIDRRLICAIGSHGQTLWHQPNGKYPFSLQLGDANMIAERTGITTVADFRSRDIAAGGQGAPLVPAYHQELLSHPEKSRAIVNIGGIANITLLPAGNLKRQTSGYDTGPGNGLIDAWILKHKKHFFDRDGDWGRHGKILPDILETLLKDDYFSITPPKSTGKELFNLSWLNEKLGRQIDALEAQDIQATLTELTAKTISDNIGSFDEVFICGGGVHNKYLLERLKYHMPDILIESTQELGVDPDWMEAMAFAWLAKQRLEGKTGNLPIVTGAKGKRILGAIYPA